MKNIPLVIVVLILFPFAVCSQNIEATTIDGKKVILKPNKTWEYDKNATTITSNCNLAADHVEPKTDKTTYVMLKQTGSTTDDLKKHVSVELECAISDIVIVAASEQLGNGMYILCVKGSKIKYKRTGSVFSKAE